MAPVHIYFSQYPPPLLTLQLTLQLTQPYLLSRPLRFWIIGNDGILHSENLEREGISHGHGNSIIHEQAYN